MTREEALKIVRENYPHFGTTEPWLDLEKALATLIPELAESEDERIRKGLVKLLTVAGEAYVVNSTGIKKDSYLTYLEKQKDRKPAEWNSKGCMGINGPSCDPGRRGRMGGVPKEISKEAEAFQAQFPGPYDKDDIITAYETAKMKAIEDLPQWKKAKIIGVGECTIGAAFEATGRRYPILYCYGYGISIEQLFEKLPKKED